MVDAFGPSDVLCFHHAIRNLLKTDAGLAYGWLNYAGGAHAGYLWNAQKWLLNASSLSGDTKGRPPIRPALNRL